MKMNRQKQWMPPWTGIGMNLRAVLLFSVLLAVAIAGCSKESKNNAGTPATQPSKSSASNANDPWASILVTSPPPNPKSVAEVRTDETITDEVVVTGRIGGRKKPFVDGVAMFILADAGMKTCDELHGDACPTPWDYCCEPEDSLKAKIATVQVVGADGKPLAVAMPPQLVPSAYVTVTGRIGQRSENGVVINATRIYVAEKGG